MKMAKASQKEIDTLMRWLQRMEAEKHVPPFNRVVFGYQTLVENCCDPASDVLEWKPGYAPSDTDRMRTALEEIERAVPEILIMAHYVELPPLVANVGEIVKRALHPEKNT